MNNHINVPISCTDYRIFDEFYDERVTVSFICFTGKQLARAVTIGLAFTTTRSTRLKSLVHFAVKSYLKDMNLYRYRK